MSDPLNSSLTRTWLIEGRARPDHQPEFLDFLKLGAMEQNFGSVNPIFNPSKDKYGAFVQAGSFRDEIERPTTSMVGHYARALKSRMLSLAMAGCAFDLQLHIGQCQDPSIFNDFEKIVIFEGVFLESYSTDDVGALEPGEQGKVDETGEVSADRMYEFKPLNLAARNPTGSILTNQLLDVIICDSSSCGDCADESDGCQKIMAITTSAGGSPTTPADVVFSLDGGQTWAAHDIDTLATGEAPSAIACVGSYVVVVSNASGSQHVALISEFDGVADPAFAEVTTGYVVGGEPNDIWSLGGFAYIVGDRGYIYKTTAPATEVVVIDAGAATISNLNRVHAISETFAVAVGDDGVIVRVESELASLLATSPIGIGTNFSSVWAKTETEWFVGSAAGVLYRTLDAGATWAIVPLSGTQTDITEIQMSSKSVMYVSATVGGKGEVYVSVDGGQSFERTPRGAAGAMPANDEITALAVCPFDVDFFVGVGLAADGVDGFIVIGSD